ncbi:MAG: tyrosine-type recombinase/integrase [Pseudonocardiaceae bacterium]
MPRPHRLAPAALGLVETYLGEFTQAGFRAVSSAEEGARAFCARFGSTEGWMAAALHEQVNADERVRRFVAWLALTARMPVSADYLIARRPRLGPIMAAYHPAASVVFTDSAAALGFVSKSAERQWAALAQVCALHATPPDVVTHALLDTTHTALDDAAARLGVSPHPNLHAILFGLQATLFHAGLSDEPPRPRTRRGAPRTDSWDQVPVALAKTLTGYLDQLRVTRRPGTVANEDEALREFGCFLARRHPDVRSAAQVGRSHVEAYKRWLAERPARHGGRLHRHTIRRRLNSVQLCFQRLIEWGAPDAPARAPIFPSDLPIKDDPLPRFLDDAAAAKLLVAARADPDPLVRLIVEFLARTGMRKGELANLTIDAVVQIGSAYWLRIPIGKLHNDRYIPLHPQLKELLDTWLANRPEDLRSKLMFTERGRPLSTARVDAAVDKVARTADLQDVSPHRLRHTLATQAINRGMSLEAIAALLGHRSLSMTLVYARIADRTVANEYFAVSEKVEALYDQPRALPADAEGAEMAKLRNQMHRRMLGNGYCARPVELDCHFESICESCTHFITTIEFRPTLQRQRDDAHTKGQLGRQKIFDGLLNRLEDEVS